MRRPMHNQFAKFFLGNERTVKMKDIDNINAAIDNPSKMDKSFAGLYDVKEFDVAGLTEKGSHRNVNHDMLGGLTKAMAIDPVNGFDIFMAHLLMDATSNMMRETLGTSNRDMAEIMMKDFFKNMNEERDKYQAPPPQKSFIEKRYAEKRRKNKFFRMNNRRNRQTKTEKYF